MDDLNSRQAERMKLCKDCEHFRIRCEYESPYAWGEATCEKHNLITFFRSKKKFETLCCIERGKDDE